MEGQVRTSRIPIVNNCCFVVPLRTGALVITIWMLLWNLYAGFAVITIPYSGGFLWMGIKGLGILYISLALTSFYGAYFIYKENPKHVARFSRFFVGSVIVYFLIQIIIIVVEELEIRSIYNSAIASCKAAIPAGAPAGSDAPCNDIEFVGVSLGPWIATFLVGVIIQAYLIIVIRSYNAELQAKVAGNPAPEKGEFQTVDMNTYGLEQA